MNFPRLANNHDANPRIKLTVRGGSGSPIVNMSFGSPSRGRLLQCSLGNMRHHGEVIELGRLLIGSPVSTLPVALLIHREGWRNQRPSGVAATSTVSRGR